VSGRHQYRTWLANDFVRRVPIDPFGPLIPVHNSRIQRMSDNGIARRVSYRRRNDVLMGRTKRLRKSVINRIR
jgi:hypothetical protein